MTVVPPWCDEMASRKNLRTMITQAPADTSASCGDHAGDLAAVSLYAARGVPTLTQRREKPLPVLRRCWAIRITRGHAQRRVSMFFCPHPIFKGRGGLNQFLSE